MRLNDPNEGVYDFKNKLMPHSVIGVETVFAFRFYQRKKFYRGSQYLQRWIGRLQALRKRIIDAWMGTFLADPAENAYVQEALLAENAQLQADGLNAQLQAQQAGLPLPPIVLFAVPEAFGEMEQ